MAALLAFAGQLFAAPPDPTIVLVEGGGLWCGIGESGTPSRLESTARKWLRGPVHLEVRNEASGVTSTPIWSPARDANNSAEVAGRLVPLGLAVSQRWSGTQKALQLDMDFRGSAERAGHTLVFDLPLLARDLRVFTPTERGVIEVDANPNFEATSYAHAGAWDGKAYVLPLVSVLDPGSDQALTFALPPDGNIPHFQVAWLDARTLRLTLSHRGMGGGQPSRVRLLLFSHAADYRSALKAYSDLYPAYFEPALRRGPYEGAFWYHHIQDHPEFAEMARQRVRYSWSSFWFTHLGEYLPDGSEWLPYTYARNWKLGQTMSDEKINAFIRTMAEHGIGTYAYFNVSEYGGAGGRTGDRAEASRILRERFANALVRNQDDQHLPSWEGAMVMNPGRRYALWPFLQDQIERHLKRLPGLAGFIIDRMDWASGFDHAHDDGLSMDGARPVENLALPIAEAVQSVCRLAHQQQMRVFVNQCWRVEVLRDTDGVCHENGYLPALGYLTPLRPASSWNLEYMEHPGDLLAFEAQLKRRLQWAVFPQMIAHEFRISQQGPDPRAADMLELYAPLLDPLIGKRQVLQAHCVRADGANDVNLFLNGVGRYMIPLTSRVRFISRGDRTTSTAAVTIAVPDAAALRWAHVFSADGPPYRALVRRSGEHVLIEAAHHGTASMIVAGKDTEPALPVEDAVTASLRARLYPAENAAAAQAAPPGERQPFVAAVTYWVHVSGEHVGESGRLKVLVNGRQVGALSRSAGRFPLSGSEGRFPLESPPGDGLVIEIRAGDEGIWFVPRRAELLGQQAEGRWLRFADWLPADGAEAGGSPGHLRLVLRRHAPQPVPGL